MILILQQLFSPSPLGEVSLSLVTTGVKLFEDDVAVKWRTVNQATVGWLDVTGMINMCSVHPCLRFSLKQRCSQ